MSSLPNLCFCFAPWAAHNALCFKMTAAPKKSTISFPGFSLLLRGNGRVSSNNTVVWGVPQGLFLALSFFSCTLMIFFILQSIFHLFSLQMMPIFFFRHNDLATLASMFNQELSYVSSCLNANKLTVHHDKSKFIISCTRRKQIDPLELNIFINHTPIALVQGDKFLGIIIYENFSWKLHVTTVCDKVTKGIGIFSQSRRYLPPVSVKTLCNYCNLIWECPLTFPSGINLLSVLKPRLFRMISS